jgi:hypothetical protein
MDVSQLKTPPLIVTAGLLLGLIGDLLLYDQPMGISFPILMAATLIALVGLGMAEKADIKWINLWLTIPILYLAIMSAVRAAPLLRFLNISGALLLLALQADRFTTRPVTSLNLGNYITRLIQTGIYSAFFAPALLRQTTIEMQSREETGSLTRRILIGVLIAAPFLLIFTILFASADLLFNVYLEDILGDITIGDIIGHSFLTAALAWVAMGGLAYALSRTIEASADPESEAEEGTSKQSFNVKNLLGTLEASIALFSIDALFLAFIGVQLAALFGGQAFLERKDLSYAEYARQGFFELLAVALITLALILALDFLTRRETTRQRFSFLLGSGLMIAMTIAILVSAFQRLQLYELAFGFTRLRLHTHVFMVWLAILLAFFLIMLFTRRTQLFATAVLFMAIGFTATLNVLNPDAFTVEHNLRRYRNDEELDVAYIGGLSADAVPHLMPLLTRYGADIRDEVGPWLRLHLDELDRRQDRAGWPSTHLSMNRAYRDLDEERGKIERYDAAYRYYWD